MEAVGDLARLRRALRGSDSIQAGPIPTDHLDLRVRLEPSSCGVRPAIGQKVGNLAALEIHDQRAVGTAPPPTPVVDPDNPQRCRCRLRRAFERPQDGVPTGRQTQPHRQPVRWSAADSMAKEPRQVGHAARAPGGEAGRIWHAAAERLSAAERIPAAPTLDREPDHDRPSLRRQVLKVTPVASVPRSRRLLAVRTEADPSHRSSSIDCEDADPKAGRPIGCVFHRRSMGSLPQFLPVASVTTFVRQARHQPLNHPTVLKTQHSVHLTTTCPSFYPTAGPSGFVSETQNAHGDTQMRRLLLASSLLTAGTGLQTTAYASSHREAPMIAGMPRLDASDFYMFRSYETGRSNYVTMIADYVPLQDPAGGPNFFSMEHNGYYDINIDNQGSGKPSFTFRFRFVQYTKGLTLNIAGKQVAIPLVNDGPITATDSSAQNVIEGYTVSMVTNGGADETLLKGTNGQLLFQKPFDRIGDKSIPNYASYASTFTYNLVVPGCGNARVFVGQRKDPFVVALGTTFDLVNYAHPIGEQYKNSATDDLAGKNVTSLVIEAPAACLTRGSDPVVGAWTTSDLFSFAPKTGAPIITQVSRLANPLVNELVIGLPDKDKFNGSLPADDSQFAKYVTNPTVPALIASVFASAGTKAPTKIPRTDLVAVFLTGVAGVNAPAGSVTPSEEMRLNTSIPITSYGQQSRLGVIGGDNAGYPNGRRPGDDVVDITIRVAMGKLYTLGLYGTPADAPSGALDFTDGAYTDSTHYLSAFPYVMPPLSASPQPIHS